MKSTHSSRLDYVDEQWDSMTNVHFDTMIKYLLVRIVRKELQKTFHKHSSDVMINIASLAARMISI